MTVMSNEDPADPSVHEPQTEAWALKLAEVPIVSRGMGWQANATATLREAAAELKRLRDREDALLDLALMLKRCAWALRRGTAPDLGERALHLLQKHGLLGGPLRDETLDEAWTARKGYASTDEAVENSASETLWCSPHCVPERQKQEALF